MHMQKSDHIHGPEIVPVKFILQDPQPLTGQLDKEINLMAAVGESVLEIALEHGINIEHSCGGVCACSTCHVYVQKGQELLQEASDDELDRVEEAPGIEINSRLACQCVIEEEGEIVIEVPAWNRNAVKEVPH